MKLQPYLFFGGCAAEALAFYERALGARVTMKMHYRDSPEPTPPGMRIEPHHVMHAELAYGDAPLFMCSDGNDDTDGRFHGFALAVNLADEAAARRAFDALAEGGQVTMPLGRTFWSPCFGMLSDRYGVGWMVGVAA